MATTCTACEAPATTNCARCDTSLCSEHAVLGQPFITARQLVSTTATTALRAPGLLGDVLFKELDMVPYCSECREEIAGKRTTEQLKFLLLLLAILVVLLLVPTYFLLLR